MWGGNLSEFRPFQVRDPSNLSSPLRSRQQDARILYNPGNITLFPVSKNYSGPGNLSDLDPAPPVLGGSARPSGRAEKVDSVRLGQCALLGARRIRTPH